MHYIMNSSVGIKIRIPEFLHCAAAPIHTLSIFSLFNPFNIIKKRKSKSNEWLAA